MVAASTVANAIAPNNGIAAREAVLSTFFASLINAAQVTTSEAAAMVLKSS